MQAFKSYKMSFHQHIPTRNNDKKNFLKYFPFLEQNFVVGVNVCVSLLKKVLAKISSCFRYIQITEKAKND